jgi:putative nucleotidyltransferase with HDIG domain
MLATIIEAECEVPRYMPSIDEILFEAGELAALPQVILKLIDLTADPKVSATDVERVIQSDQGTTARVLTLANSSYYGLPRRISSVREAVVFLGFKTVRSLAMTVSAFNMFLGRSDQASLTRRDLWRHSLNTALCTKIVCSKLTKHDSNLVESQEAFTAGLLHDVGKMALDIAMSKQYAAALSEAKKANKRFHEVEADFLPYTHSLIGKTMADRWSLPEVLCDAILNHHSPMAAQVNPHMAAVIGMANEIAHGVSELTPIGDVVQPSVLDDAAAILSFSPQILDEVNASCLVEMEKGLSLNS